MGSVKQASKAVSLLLYYHCWYYVYHGCYQLATASCNVIAHLKTSQLKGGKAQRAVPCLADAEHTHGCTFEVGQELCCKHDRPEAEQPALPFNKQRLHQHLFV